MLRAGVFLLLALSSVVRDLLRWLELLREDASYGIQTRQHEFVSRIDAETMPETFSGAPHVTQPQSRGTIERVHTCILVVDGCGCSSIFYSACVLSRSHPHSRTPAQRLKMVGIQKQHSCEAAARAVNVRRR